LPTITVGYSVKRDGDITGWIRNLSRKMDSIYVNRSDSEIGRMLIRNALKLEMVEGELKGLVEYLSNKKGCKYEDRSEDTIIRMLLEQPLEEEFINEWLEEVAKS
jgi:hypothetical protein